MGKDGIAIIPILILVGVLSVGAYFFFNNSSFSSPTRNPVKNLVKQTSEELKFAREDAIISDTNVHNPEVIRLDDGTYRMFAHRGTEIISFSSADGKSFTQDEGVRIQGSMPTLVKLPDGRLRMYFSAFPQNNIMSATSKDGTNFEIEPGVRLERGASGALDQAGLTHPGVLRMPNGEYKMYYDGVSTLGAEAGPDAWTVMSASSPDGLAWTKDDGTRIPEICLEIGSFDDEVCVNGAWNVDPRIEDGEIVLYFSAEVDPIEYSGIWKATSADGLDFTTDTPILGQSEEFYGKEVQSNYGPKGVPQDPFVLEVENGLRLFYWTPEGGILSAFSD